MKLSQFIARLAKMIEEHGDVNVVLEFGPGPTKIVSAASIIYDEIDNEVIIS
jgi:hypothetical protein